MKNLPHPLALILMAGSVFAEGRGAGGWFLIVYPS